MGPLNQGKKSSRVDLVCKLVMVILFKGILKKALE